MKAQTAVPFVDTNVIPDRNAGIASLLWDLQNRPAGYLRQVCQKGSVALRTPEPCHVHRPPPCKIASGRRRARQIPNDARWPQMVGLRQVKYLLDDLWRRSVLGVLRDRLLANQGSLTMLLERRLPAVETGSAYVEVPAGPTDMPRFLGKLQDRKFALNLAILRAHRRHPPSPIGL